MHDQIQRVVNQIYDAALEPGLWSSTLEAVCELLRSSGATLLLGDPRHADAVILHSTGIDPEALVRYDAHYVHEDVRLQALLPQPVGTIATNTRLMTAREFEHTEFCHDFLRSFDFHYMVGCVLMRSEEMFSSLGIHRSKCAGEYSEPELRLYETILPHLQRAVEINMRLSNSEAQAKATSEALDRVPVGIILVDTHGRPVRVNRIAQAVLDERDGLSMSDGALSAARAEITAALRALLHCAAQTGTGRASDPGGVLALPRPSLKRPLSVLVTPLRVSPDAWGLRGAAAAVFVTDPESRVETAETALKQIYGLTTAEAHLAAVLLQGKSLKDAGHELRIGKETARTHLRQVLGKTDTRRQSDLILTLLRGPAQIRQAPGEGRLTRGS
jgi:DNA-binding CsgD family transcriptional regulator